MRMIIISGLSGSGKRVALHMLEDLNYYCIDNMPASMLSQLADDMLATGKPDTEQVAISIDARARPKDLQHFPELISKLKARKNVELSLAFLECDDQTLINRYNETRRKHPLSAGDRSLGEAISLERKLMEPIVENADIVIDTGRTSMHDLRDIIRGHVHDARAGTLSLQIQSFGFKHGAPRSADFVFDVRCLPNPHWIPELRSQTGKDQGVRDYLDSQEICGHMYEDIRNFVDRWIPRFEADNHSYLTIAIGCTGGQHRSVYLVEKLGRYFGSKRQHVLVRHTELK